MGYPKRSADKTYLFQYLICDNLEPSNYFKIFVSAVERQLRYARSLRTKVLSSRGTRYPHTFKNKDELDLSIPGSGPWQEFPLHKSLNFENGDKPGPARVIYTALGYDVVYHNPSKKKRGMQTNGAANKVDDFVKARRVSRRANRRGSV